MTRARNISLAVVLALVAAATVVVVASGSDGGATAAAKHPALNLRATSLGTVIVDGSGRTLYAFGHDLTNKSRCSGACASNWPPAKSPAKASVGSGLAQAKLKLIRRSGGSRQLSYDGHPLYRFIGDSKPGEVNGENIVAFGGKWDAVSKAGRIVTAAPTTSPSSSAPAQSAYPSY